MFWVLLHSDVHLRPWEVRRLTLPELSLTLDGDTSRPRLPGGAQRLPDVPGKFNAVSEYAKWWRGLTPRDRLDVARGRKSF